MKRLIPYLFIILYLTSFSEVRQVLKLPLLIEHYLTHKQQNEEMTLATFFRIHYLEPQVQDADYEQDMQLPFKQIDLVSMALGIAFPQKQMQLYFTKEPTNYREQSHNFAYVEPFYPSVFTSIWQPPKI
ncbi:hypothetical protein BPO_0557 [Bergeyella porcorum]|uniref:Uncharacterized protein n=1 Tax=Bergeyella porcorum TaxID=1735111 RepID=A0AAU0F0I2_9FLAO